MNKLVQMRQTAKRTGGIKIYEALGDRRRRAVRGPPFGRSSPPLSRRGFPGWPSVHAHAAAVRVTQRQYAATPGALSACGGHGEEHSGPQVQRPDERLFI
jgi:hypothetical protein